MNPDGSKVTPILPTTTGYRSYYDLACSPDGSRITFYQISSSKLAPITRSNLYLINTDGTELMEVGRFTDPSWSPDGKKIAVSSRGGADQLTGFGDIYVISIDSLQATKLSDDNSMGGPNFGGPTWSPDGRRIAFSAGFSLSTGFDIHVMNSDGSNQVNLTKSRIPHNEESPAWSSDGQRIAYVDYAGNKAQIYAMNVDGSGQRNLSANPAKDTGPAWSPDSGHIVFTSDRDGNDEIYVMNADGSNQINITNNSAQDNSPTWCR